MKSPVIFVVIFILLIGIEISHQARPPKAQRTARAQTAPQAAAASSSNAIVELFDVLDSNKDGYITRDDLNTFCRGTAYTSDEDKYNYNEMYETIGDYANKRQFTWGHNANNPSVDLQQLNGNRNYDSAALQSVLGINAAQAQTILGNRPRKTANEVAEFIRTKKFAPE